MRKFHICFCFVTAMPSQATSPRMTSLIQCYHLWSSQVSFFWGQRNNCTVSRRYLFGLNSEWERSKEVVLSWHRRNDWTALRRSFALVGPVKGKHLPLKAIPTWPALGKPSRKKSAVFFNIVQKAFDPPPLSFEHHVVNFSWKFHVVEWPPVHTKFTT